MLEIIIYRMLLYLKQATTTNSSYYKFIYSEIRRSNSVRRLQYFLFLYVFLPAVKSYFFSQRRQKKTCLVLSLKEEYLMRKMKMTRSVQLS